MANQERHIVIICCCGWGAERDSIRAANSAFFVHQLTAPGKNDHVSFTQDLTAKLSLTRSEISRLLEGELG